MPVMSGLADTTLRLNSGARIPQVGLGVWQTPSGATTRHAVTAALNVGYRHVDTARIYGNEADVGAAVRESGVAREEVFVTTKLWNADQGYDSALRAFDTSLKTLGLDYIDLYPGTGRRPREIEVGGSLRKAAYRPKPALVLLIRTCARPTSGWCLRGTSAPRCLICAPHRRRTAPHRCWNWAKTTRSVSTFLRAWRTATTRYRRR